MSKHAFLLSRIRHCAKITLLLYMTVSASIASADATVTRLPPSLLVPGGVAIVPTAGNVVTAQYPRRESVACEIRRSTVCGHRHTTLC